MHKKKIQSLVVAGLLTVGVVGGTLAWFTSQDNIKNVFNTGSVTDTDDGLDAGIDVKENFPGSTVDKDGNSVYDKPVTPNESLTKEVWVENTANYDQIIKAKVVKNFVDSSSGKIVTHYKMTETTNAKKQTVKKIEYTNNPTGGGWTALNLKYIELGDNLNGSGSPDQWTLQTLPITDTSAKSESNWYFYNKVLKPAKNADFKTNNLLKTVTLSKDAGSEYKNLRFDVEVEAQSIQAANGAIKDTSAWQNVPDTIQLLDESKSK